MATITTEMIKELRDKTGGVSVMQCKKALEEAGGDMEKALVIIQRASKSAALKKADRTLGAGVVQSYIHSTGNIGSLVLLSCETDFVSRNEEFKTLARDIAMHVAAADPQYLKTEDIPEADRKKAEEVLAEEIGDKPEDMKAKILEGKLASYFQEKVLLEQPFIKDPERTIGNLVESAIQKFGEKVELTRFVRFTV
ncbi:MAG TPA: elongation factor Ts [Candidatus Paceibacterota bacterium]|nr:elongation factor Ts [Candidatus Paceibacterota bacterium]